MTLFNTTMKLQKLPALQTAIFIYLTNWSTLMKYKIILKNTIIRDWSMTYTYAKIWKKIQTVLESYNVASPYMICIDRDISKRLHNTQGKLVRGFHFFTEKTS